MMEQEEENQPDLSLGVLLRLSLSLYTIYIDYHLNSYHNL